MKKKFFLFLFVLLICTVAFARGFSVRVGAGFSGAQGATCLPKAVEIAKEQNKVSFRMAEFAFAVGTDYKFDNNFTLFGDLDIDFPLEAKITSKPELSKKEFRNTYHPDAKIYAVDVAFNVGAGYTFEFKNIPFDLTIGGGFAFNSFNLSIKDKDNSKENHSVTSVGLNLHCGIDYCWSENWAVAFAVNPNLMVLESSRSKVGTTDKKDNLFRINLMYQATVGVKYSF